MKHRFFAVGFVIGVSLVLVGELFVVLSRTGFGLYKAMQAAKAGVQQSLTATDVRVIIHNPILWFAFLAAIGVGLWIVRARMHQPS